MFGLADCTACGERVEWHWSVHGTRVPVDMSTDHDPALATLTLDDDIVYFQTLGRGTHVDHRVVCKGRARHPSAPR